MSHIPGDYYKPQDLSNYEVYYDSYFDGSYLLFGYAIVKNLAYNTQYIEYLIHTLSTHPYHSVVEKGHLKTLILTCATTIETVLECTLRVNNIQDKDEWEVKETYFSNVITTGSIKSKSKTEIRKEIMPKDADMTFARIVQICKDKKVLGDSSRVYKHLKDIREIRNKIHLLNIKHRLDTDWNTFNWENANNTLTTFSEVLDSLPFTSEAHPNLMNFLKVQIGPKLN